MSETVRKVLLVSPAWPPGTYANGIITYVQHLQTGLKELGIESRVATHQLTDRSAGAYQINGALSQKGAVAKLLARVGRRLFPEQTAQILGRLDANLNYRPIEREWPFDVLEVEESFGTARWIAESVSAPVVVRLHGPWIVNGAALGVPRDAAFDARVAAEGCAISKATAISSPSQDVLDRVRAHYGLELPNAVVIPCPGPEPTPEQMWNREAAEPNHVVFVGRFDRHKGADIAIQAFLLLAHQYPLLKLTMAGPDHGFEDGEGRRWSYSEYIAAKVPEIQRNRIEFLGHLDQQAIARLRCRAGVVISGSRYETFGLAVVEALAQGCPVVCPDAGGLREIVEDGISGLVYRAGDQCSLARGIEAFQNAPDRAAQIGRQAAQRFRERYLPIKVANTTREFYEDVCRRHTKQSGARRK